MFDDGINSYYPEQYPFLQMEEIAGYHIYQYSSCEDD